jgi:HlyD family secretion protein
VRFSSGATSYLLQADAQTSARINALRAEATDLLAQLELRGRGATTSLSQELDATAIDLETIDAFVTQVASAINRYTPDDTADQSVYDSFQTSIASARTSLATARSEVATMRASYAAAESALVRARRALELSFAGATSQAIAIQQAGIEVALRAADAVRTKLSDSILVSPIGGTVASVSVSAGESVGLLEPVVEVLADGAYEVEAYIPEADIADISLGDTAHVTFDAFSDAEPRVGEVVRIALSETMREGVPTYKTTIIFTEPLPADMRLRPGMTADVDIATTVRQDVLFVPTRSVQNVAGRTYVRIPENGAIVERDIVTGVRGSEGTIEVVGGLAEGDEVILYLEEAS